MSGSTVTDSVVSKGPTMALLTSFSTLQDLLEMGEPSAITEKGKIHKIHEMLIFIYESYNS